MTRRPNTKVLTESRTSFGWRINPYRGCHGGCKYCYGFVINRQDYQDWVKPQKRKINVVDELKKDIEKLRKSRDIEDIRDVFLGSIVDAYQPLEKKHRITREVIKVLKENKLPFTILTKFNLVLEDIDLLKGYEYCRVGCTITSLDEDFRKDLEPFTSSYKERIRVLKRLKKEGIPTYCSIEPIFPTEDVDPIKIIKETEPYVDLFEFGKLRIFPQCRDMIRNYLVHESDKYYVDTFERIMNYCSSNNIPYCTAFHSKSLIEKAKLPFERTPPLKYAFLELLSALQKDIRRGKEYDALFWAVQLERHNPETLWYRLKVMASEDVGIAYPWLPMLIETLEKQYFDARRSSKQNIRDSSRLFLTNAVLILAKCPKSRIVDDLLNVVYGEIQHKNKRLPIPDYALDMHTLRGAKKGRKKGTKKGLEHFYNIGCKLAS